MLDRFRLITKGLYRGSCPSIKDVNVLHDVYGIKKIVSLDQKCGERINRVCKLLGIKHIIIPINMKDFEPIARLLSYNLHELLIDGGPTYVHCLHGKDRTGMVVAMYQCQYMGYSYERAIAEAKKLGFGIGLDPSVVKFYEKIINKSCKDNHKDNNSTWDIADNSRDEAASTIDSADVKSFAPQLDPNHQYGYDYAYDQYPTRQNVVTKQNYNDKSISEGDQIPQVGLYDNDAGIKGSGPIENGGGFVNTI